MIFSSFIPFLFPLTFFLLCFSVGKDILVYLYLWQSKEYRPDRFWVYLSTREAKKELFHPFSLLKSLVFLAPVFDHGYAVGIGWVLVWFSILLLDFAFFLYRFLNRRFPRPQPTPRLLFMALTCFGLMAFFFFSPFGNLFNFLLAGLFFLVSAVALLFNLPSYFVKDLIIRRAADRLASFPDLLVIGITGSYGKTSVKEFLAAILRPHFRVLFTHHHQNTIIGVARQILKELDSSHQVYLVEMGAYKRGEIAALCRLVKPRFAVLTALNAQHLPLFGSLENQTAAKMELPGALPADGKIFFNLDSPRLEKALSGFSQKKISFGFSPEAKAHCSQSEATFQDLSFTARYGREKLSFSVSLLGRHNIVNLLAALAVGEEMGLSLTQMRPAVASLKPLPGTLSVHSSGRITLIDASYNCNPDGLLAGLDFLALFPGQRALVLQPMIELGEMAVAEHVRTMKKAAKICDLIFWTNDNYLQETLLGLPSAVKKKIIVEKSFGPLTRRLPLTDAPSAILFAGKGSQKYLPLFNHE